jgi:hypothetical protein
LSDWAEYIGRLFTPGFTTSIFAIGATIDTLLEGLEDSWQAKLITDSLRNNLPEDISERIMEQITVAVGRIGDQFYVAFNNNVPASLVSYIQDFVDNKLLAEGFRVYFEYDPTGQHAEVNLYAIALSIALHLGVDINEVLPVMGISNINGPCNDEGCGDLFAGLVGTKLSVPIYWLGRLIWRR